MPHLRIGRWDLQKFVALWQMFQHSLRLRRGAGVGSIRMSDERVQSLERECDGW